MRRDLVILGIALIVAGMIFTATTSLLLDHVFGDFFSFLGLVGLVVLIVGVVKSRGGRAAGMSQQQQVVIIPPSAPSGFTPVAEPPGAAVRCGTCQSLNEPDARFCTMCGHELGSLGAPKRARATAAGKRRA